jgi:hypothetical protein
MCGEEIVAWASYFEFEERLRVVMMRKRSLVVPYFYILAACCPQRGVGSLFYIYRVYMCMGPPPSRVSRPFRLEANITPTPLLSPR